MESTIKAFVIFAALQLAACFPAISEPLHSRNFVGSLDLSRYGPEIFNTPDVVAGKSLRDWVKSKGKGNPEEQGHYFEGDIMLDVEARNGVILNSQKWKDAKIPYEIRGSFTSQQKNMLSDAIEQFKKYTCIKFIPRAGEKDFVVFENDKTGCWSSVGKSGGAQTVNLQTPGCMSKVGTAMHEILHAVGFFHEQNRFDRDNHVRVNFRNIPQDKFVNFEKISEDEITPFGVPYDIESVLHYSAYAFSKNNDRTIEALKDETLNDKMGQRDGFSKGDIVKINSMYCNK